MASKPTTPATALLNAITPLQVVVKVQVATLASYVLLHLTNALPTFTILNRRQVDGFSVPIVCTLASGDWTNHGSNSLGCDVDILSECTGSDATYDSAAKVCHNPTGASSQESLTTKPWSNCKEGSSEVWYGDQGYYEFDGSTGFPVTCTIGSASPPSKRDLELEEPVAEALEARQMGAVHKHGAASHFKRTRRHALGLANIIGAGKL